MPGSRASVFGEAEDFQAALSADGVAGLLVTGRGQFRARMTQVALEGLRLAAVEEQLARIAFVAVPAGTVLVAFPIDAGPSPVWGGIEIRPREIIAFEPGQRLHTRTAGPSHWGAIHVLGQQLAHYGRAVSGTPFAVPSAARWRPWAAVVRELRGLHRAAVRKAEARAAAFTDIEAAHGLELQLLHALIECLSEGGKGRGRPAGDTAAFSPASRIGSLQSLSCPCLTYVRLSASPTACCASAARRTWAWAHAATVTSVECNRCTARCGTETLMGLVSLRSQGDTVLMPSAVLRPIIAPYMANCRQSLCGAPCAGVPETSHRVGNV